ncbi:hypothetical protein SAMN05216196_101912 [Lutimaribacter pacificus]|uniref:Anti-sigma factor NepR domain-containing protein n=1 Tax=Lutimaribacter pacificus TaxID=391948 RepID=A0A1H0CEJ7_9RHOB|nr:hypothetical protein [Lutimaribacter pacificus]SDN56314.1 hypothetical protein SAMN05216196_101912 [Lutimaribacter pacificus]SHJ45361.1 hypothetical protein SAMN05444142_101305 [Lutimaribacter pacificus]
MTRTPPRPGQPVLPADRTDILTLLGVELMPDMPTLEALLDRIERREARP